MTLRFSPAVLSRLSTDHALRYCTAPLAVAVAMGLRIALENSFGPGLPPYITFYPMLMAVAILAGFGPGLVATALAGASAAHWIIAPIGHLTIGSPVDRVGTAIFILMGLFVSAVAEIHRRHRDKAAAYERDADWRANQEQLRASEERLRIALQAADLGTWDVDLATGSAIRSLRHDQIFGYQELQAQWSAEIAARHVVAEDLPLVREAYARLLESGHLSLEARVRWPDGSIHWIRSLGRALNDAGGRPMRLIGVVADITAGKETEDKLRRSEALYRAIAESIDFGVWVCEADGRNTYASDSFLKMTGLTQQQYAEFGWGEALHPDDAAATRAAWRQCVRSGGEWNREIRFRGADGGWHHVLARGVPIRNEQGEVACWTGINLDITALKEAQEDLRANEQRMRLATEATGVGVWEWNILSNRIHWDSQMFRIYGIAPTADGSLQYADWCAVVLPEDLHVKQELVRDTLRRLGQSSSEFRIRRPGDGELRHLESVETVRTNSHGQAESLIGTNLDITGRKRTEADLRAAMAEAERANRAKSRFLAAASHDLRQPLSALSIYAGLLKKRVAPEDRKVVASIQDCVAGLSALLNDLLDLSKLEAGVVVPSISDFPIAATLASLESVYRPEALLKGLQLRGVPSRLTARSDPVLLKRMLGNLVANAVRYTAKGGVLIACRRRQGKTWVEIWDTGIGIAAHQTAEIFEEFKQLDEGARTQGTGLGLAIVAKTAALLGLEVNVRSRPGRGSVFAVEMPLGEPEAVIPVKAPRVPQRSSLRIAMVEDNRLAREALQFALQAQGHQVIAAANGAALLDAIERTAPQIVVSDYRLGGGETGYDVISAVRERFGAQLPALLITGDTDPKLLRTMSERGIVLLHKPLDLEILQAKLDDLTWRVGE